MLHNMIGNMHPKS